MHSLIGDRFLKRFIGNRAHRRGSNPAGEEEYLLENVAAKTAEPECPHEDDLLSKEASLANNETGETHQTKNTHARST